MALWYTRLAVLRRHHNGRVVEMVYTMVTLRAPGRQWLSRRLLRELRSMRVLAIVGRDVTKTR